ncbi:MAG: hypothetical protein WDW38_003757 [Sanguina aurantia]
MRTSAAIRKALGATQRFVSTSAARFDEALSVPSGPKEFAEAWAKRAPGTLDLPQFPTNFLKATAGGESQVQGDLFPKDSVLLPGVDGYFGLKASHVPTIAQLKPGLVELHAAGEVVKYFISGGFAFVHPNGVTDICVLEAATLDQIDPAAVKTALASALSGQGQGDDMEQAVNRTAVELYGALDGALEQQTRG